MPRTTPLTGGGVDTESTAVLSWPMTGPAISTTATAAHPNPVLIPSTIVGTRVRFPVELERRPQSVTQKLDERPRPLAPTGNVLKEVW